MYSYRTFQRLWLNELISVSGNSPGALAMGLQAVVDDLTPQLGGNLDVNGNSIVSASNADINITPDGTGNVVLGPTLQTRESEAPTGTNIITAAESGKVFFLNATTGFVSTLPALAAGLFFTFIIQTIPTSGNDTVVTASSANVIEGAVDVNSTLVLASNEDEVNFVASTCLIGDMVHLICDGTSWFLSGFSGAAGGITITA